MSDMSDMSDNVAPRNCQDLVTLFIRVAKHSDPSVMFRELHAVTAAEERSCAHLGLHATRREKYTDYVGHDSGRRILMFDECYKDFQKLKSAHVVYADMFSKHLAEHRTWMTWFQT
jgi:hypothetical protein